MSYLGYKNPSKDGEGGSSAAGDHVPYLFIHVFQARDLPKEYVIGGCDSFVELKIGDYNETGKSTSVPEWNQLFTFPINQIRGSKAEILVKGHGGSIVKRDIFLGRILFDLNQITTSARPLSPHWYRLEDRKGDKVTAELLLAIWVNENSNPATRDLVKQMQYLFVRIDEVTNISDGCEPYVELKYDICKATTGKSVNRTDPGWGRVIAFPHDKSKSSVVEVIVRNKKAANEDNFVGRTIVDLNQVLQCKPLLDNNVPNTTHLYDIDDREGDKTEAAVKLAVWIGTQADDSFGNSWHSDTLSTAGVYALPKFWYIRVYVIEAHDLAPCDDESLQPKLYVLAMLGNQSTRTRNSGGRVPNPQWNEELVFATSEPFEEPLVLNLVERGLGRKEVCGRCAINLKQVPVRVNDEQIGSRWYDLSNVVVSDDDFEKKTVFSGRIHVRICLEAGYHVIMESTNGFSSDYRPPERQLWRPCIGILDLGIIEASGLKPMKNMNNQNRTDAYCVVQYGMEWVRTRTITDSLNPKWNEQYQWEVYDPCTVITIGLFDDSELQGYRVFKDSRIGMVRIHLSTLYPDQVYEHNYPILVLQPSGLEKMGELKLAVRLTCYSWFNVFCLYSQPLLPTKHYTDPLGDIQLLDHLIYAITGMVSNWFDHSEPRLKREVVEYMMDTNITHMWSLRKIKIRFKILMDLVIWFDQVRKWEKPLATLWVHMLLVILLVSPTLLPSAIFLSLSIVGLWNYCRKPKQPPEADFGLDCSPSVVATDLDELDEEFDTFPTTRPPDVVCKRYDRLREIGTRVQNGAGEIATNLERFVNLPKWIDPRATTIFMVFCLFAAVVSYFSSSRVVLFMLGLYLVRHPRLFRVPLYPINFFTRLPDKADLML